MPRCCGPPVAPSTREVPRRARARACRFAGRAGEVTDGKGKHRIAATLRESKKNDLTRYQLDQDWQNRLTDLERAALDKVRNKQIARTKEISPRESVDFAVNHLFQREDVVTETWLPSDGQLNPG